MTDSTETNHLKKRIDELETELSRARTDLLRYDRMWRSDISFYIMDSNYRIKEMNPRSLRALGLKEDDLGELRMPDLFTPEDAEFSQANLDKALDELKRHGRNNMVEIRFRGRRESPIRAALTGFYIPERDEIIGTIIDMNDFSFSFTFSESFFNNMPVASIVLNATSGEIYRVSDRFRSLSEIGDNTLIGKNVSDTGLFSMNGVDSNVLFEICQQKELHNFEIGVKTKSGGTRSCVGSVCKLVLETEPCLLLSMIDITPQKETEEALKTVREINQTLLNSSMDMMVLQDRDGTVIEVNQAILSAMGLEKDEVVGKHLLSLFTSNTVGQRRKTFEELLRTGKPVHQIDFDSSLDRAFDTRLYPIKNDEGEIIQIATYSRDITEQNKQETTILDLRSLLDTIINAMPSILISVDQDKQITNWNRETERVTGLSYDEAIGKDLFEVFPVLKEYDVQIDATIFEAARQTLTKKAITWNGETLFWNIDLFPLNQELVRGAAIRIDDVTNNVTIEQLLIQTEKMMTIGGLAAGMAHELNNPLASIVQSSQNIIRRLSPDFDKNKAVADELGIDLALVQKYLSLRKISDFLTAIEESSRRAANIITNMLQFSRKSNNDHASSDINQIVESALNLSLNDYNIKKQIDSKKIRFVKDLGQNLPVIPCVENEIQQVILNLLKNASDALFGSKVSEPEVRIQTQREGHYLTIKVSDNGPGIGENIKKKLFEPFFTTKPVGMGTGLGLSVSYMIITQNHGGTLNVDSVVGQGAMFTIALPIKN